MRHKIKNLGIGLLALGLYGCSVPSMKSPTPKASHDSSNPNNFEKFMLADWMQKDSKLPEPINNVEIFSARRAALSKKHPGELIIIPTGHLKVRSNDTFYSFRPNSDFYYLTGNLEPDCVLTFIPEENGTHREVLFVEPNPGKTDSTFFTDRVKGELWEGARLGVPESRAKYGVNDTRALSELESVIAKNPIDPKKKYRILRHNAPTIEKLFGLPTKEQVQLDHELMVELSEMRLIKDETEIAEIQEAVRSTQRGFEDVIRRLKNAKSERELEGVFFTRARVEGNDVGYGSIVASGSHACTLHWKKNDGVLRKGELLLLDAGVEGNSLYTADITRTIPINGKYTREQKQIYELVLAAQEAGLKAVRPGNDFLDPNREAMKILAAGLERLGILPTSAQEALKDNNQFYKRYSLHNVSHMLGLDVHDCAQARSATYRFGKLKPGMVLTVEPGLYFQTDDLTVPEKYRGIGIRIEDDVVVTETGYKNLSRTIPREVKAVEAWIKKLWK